jgi:hypothetical protein
MAGPLHHMQAGGEQRAADLEEALKREEKADLAVSTPDPVRDERLRDRFDRSRRQ